MKPERDGLALRLPAAAVADVASRTRFGVVAFTVALAVIMSIDRVCISQAAPFIRRDLGLSTIHMGWAFTAFTWAYALFETPGGWLGDRLGTRKALTRIVIWWSLFTAATGWVGGLGSLIVVRALFGAGEAGFFPNASRVQMTWLPPGERNQAQGLLWLAARWGGALTPLLVVLLLDHLAWRRVFELFGLVGLGWVVLFYRWFRDRPEDHPRVNAAERRLLADCEVAVAHGPVPWRAFLRSPTVWLLWAQYMCIAYGSTFYLTWLPTYVQEARGITLTRGALWSGVPLLLGGMGSLCSGLLAAPISRRLGSLHAARRMLAMTGCLGAALGLVVSIQLDNPIAGLLMMGVSSFMNDLAIPAAWATCMDMGGRYAGTLSGTMNMMGNLMGGVSAVLVGYILTWTNRNWSVPFVVAAAMYVVGGVCWACMKMPKRALVT